MRVVMVAARARGGVIGNGPDIPWQIPGEQAGFKALTTGHTLLMGRTTFESIGRPLPGRTTIVLTRDPAWAYDGVLTAPDIDTALALAAALGQRLSREAGAALLFDYGYWPSACGDTLQAVRGHRPHPVLAEPGSADLTAHVDFAAVADAATAAGARTYGSVPQGTFLEALGLGARAAALTRHATPKQAAEIASACRRLIAPKEMGTLFKALALTHPALPAPAGFPSEQHGAAS